MKSQHSDAATTLYRTRSYPPMSHPVSDPAMSSIAAWMGGLQAPDPARAKILEIGCAEGHNLLPLAQRWPDANFTGVDLSETMIGEAKRRAEIAGIGNVTFIAEDLRTLDLSGQAFDYIIAHGFFSWVPDDVKAALLKFCPAHLTPSGIATISFNLWTGWESRLPVIAAAKKIKSDYGIDDLSALGVLREATKDPHLQWIIDDMIGKGPEILLFDDFAEVNDPWPLDDFAVAAAKAGLRWLGESDPAENIPSALDEQSRESLMHLVSDPLKMQMAADEMAGSSFRSGVLCRHDAPLLSRMTTAIVLEMSVRFPEENLVSADPAMQPFYSALKEFAPSCVPVKEVVERIPDHHAPTMARMIFHAITRGQVRARSESTRFDAGPLSCYRLNAFRLLCAQEKIPLVDIWHVPCSFPDHHYDLLATMDGTRSFEELAELSKQLCPDLDFEPWLAHLTGRGIFTHPH